MTICNMAVELGGRAALIAADEKAYTAAAGRAHSDMLRYDNEDWASEPDAEFDKVFQIDAAEIAPLVSWGASPDQSIPSMARFRPSPRKCPQKPRQP